MKRPLLKATAAIAAMAAIATVTPFSLASAAPSFPVESVPVGITPSSGTSGTTFALSFPAAQFCPGDSVAGYRWGTFITPAAEVAPETFTFAGSPIGTSTTTTKELRTTTGIQIRAQNPGLGDGIVVPPIDVSFNNINFASLAVNPGAYNIGIACTLQEDPDGAGPLPNAVYNKRYWTAPITITASPGSGPQGFTYAFGAAPAAPALTTSSYNSATSTATVNFTSAAATPAIIDYTATFVPVGAAAPIAPITVVAPATSITVPGVALGSSYTVTLTARNSTGTSVLSNPLTLAGAASSSAVVVNPIADVTVGNGLTVNWLAPTSPTTPAPSSYTVDVTGPTTLSFPGVTGLSQALPATLALGNYSVVVTPVYAPGSGVSGTASSPRTFAVRVSTLIEQEITVTRPQLNALILTQRCGVNGALPAETATARFPRAIDALGASTEQVGTVPTGDTQANFDQYPVPANPVYPTRCGLALSNVQLVTSGALRGQYFTAFGALNQVTVADFRDADAGWTLTGTMADFTDGLSNSFDGNYLGWSPADPIVTAPTAAGYTQTVVKGDPVEPGSGVGSFAGPGLKAGRTLASTPTPTATSGGTGIADMNARVKLLIPTTANAANYSGILTFTVA